MNTEQMKSAGGLLTDALSHVSALVRKEVDLARAELQENLHSTGAAVGMIVGAVVIVLTALNVLCAALVAALTEAGIPGPWSALIVGGALAAAAYILAKKGIDNLKLSSLAPTRTAENVKRDAQVVKEAYNDQ